MFYLTPCVLLFFEGEEEWGCIREALPLFNSLLYLNLSELTLNGTFSFLTGGWLFTGWRLSARWRLLLIDGSAYFLHGII